MQCEMNATRDANRAGQQQQNGRPQMIALDPSDICAKQLKFVPIFDRKAQPN
jgi:hypothetical protein